MRLGVGSVWYAVYSSQVLTKPFNHPYQFCSICPLICYYNASNKASYDLAVGNTDDTTAVMLAATKAETAIQLTTQITTRAVNAYKEIMQMNI